MEQRRYRHATLARERRPVGTVSAHFASAGSGTTSATTDNAGAIIDLPDYESLSTTPSSRVPPREIGDTDIGDPFRVTYHDDAGEPGNLRILDVEGDLMEPEIREGDWVVIDLASRLPEAGGAFLLRLGERLMTRQVEAMPGDAEEDERLRLIPAHNGHAPSRAEDVHIRDKVLWVVRTGRRRRRPG